MKWKLLALSVAAFTASAGAFWIFLAFGPEPDAGKKSAKSDNPVSATAKAGQSTQNKPEKTVQVRMNREAIKLLTGPEMSEAVSAARIIPVAEGESVAGFKIIAIKADGLFGKTGFKNQDVIVSLDGVNLDQPEMGFEIINAFDGSNPNFYMDLKRGNSLIRLQFSYKD